MRLTIPNQLTLLRVVLTPVFLYYFVQDDMDMRLTGTVISSITDWYDGYIARKLNIISRWGQFMDPLADKILVSAALIVFAWLGFMYWWMVIIIVVRDFLITFLRIFALHVGKSIVTSDLAKWKTFLQMTAVFVMLLFLNFPQADIYHLAAYPPPYTHWTSIMFLVVSLLTAYSGIVYLVDNHTHIIELYKRTLKIFTR
jgi:CDP-diacylglycerol--glycerol-3-phosphate 3-phosphatidyltransferase